MLLLVMLLPTFADVSAWMFDKTLGIWVIAVVWSMSAVFGG